MKPVNRLTTSWTPVHAPKAHFFSEQVAISEPADLLRTGALRAARLLVAQETHLHEESTATALITAAVHRLGGAGPIDDRRERLLVMAITHLLLQVPPGTDRDHLTDVVEELVGRCPGHFL